MICYCQIFHTLHIKTINSAFIPLSAFHMFSVDKISNRIRVNMGNCSPLCHTPKEKSLIYSKKLFLVRENFKKIVDWLSHKYTY